MTRRPEFDALRGLMLLLMTLTHLPTRFAIPIGQPFGYVSAAEGFVLLSGFLAGAVYMQRQRKEGAAAMRRAAVKRAAKIYLCQVALLAFLFTVIAALGSKTGREAIINLMSFFWGHPWTAVVSSLFLIHNPPLLDILPMYVLFMLASPVLLNWGARRGWLGVFAGSMILWLACQLGLGLVLYEFLAGTFRIRVPVEHTGSFEWFGWQFLWVLGLWMGAQSVTPESKALPDNFPRWLIFVAAAVAIVGFSWRHLVGQVPFSDPLLNQLQDKWFLGPLRLLNLFALMVLTMQFGTDLYARLPRLRPLEIIGAEGLPVFCTHLVLSLLALALVGESLPERRLWIDVVILAASLPTLYVVALISAEFSRREAGKPASAGIEGRRTSSQVPGDHLAPNRVACLVQVQRVVAK